MARPKVEPVLTEGLMELLDSIIPEHSKDMKQSELRGICLSHGYKTPSIKLARTSDKHREFWANWIRYYDEMRKVWTGDDDNRDEFMKGE